MYTKPTDIRHITHSAWTRSFQITSEQDRYLYAIYVPYVNNYELIPGTAHYWPIEKLKIHKSPGMDQIPAELFEAEIRTIC